MNKTLTGIAEGLIVAAVMLFIFLPVRLVFYNLVSDNWIGSFGVISLVVVVMVILSKRNKLGAFGRMYWRTLTKVHKGKARFFSYFMMGMMLYFWGSSIAGMNYAIDNPDEIKLLIGNNTMTIQDHEAMQRLESSIQSKDVIATSKEIQKEFDKYPTLLVIIMFPLLFLMPLFNFITWSAITSIMNEFTKGWFLHFATVFFIESLEVVGILIYTYIVTKKSKIQPSPNSNDKP